MKKTVLGINGKNQPKITWEKPWEIFINGSSIGKARVNDFRTDISCNPIKEKIGVITNIINPAQ